MIHTVFILSDFSILFFFFFFLNPFRFPLVSVQSIFTAMEYPDEGRI